MAIPKAIANFTTSLAIKMTSSASSFTLTASTDPDGTTLSGTFYVIIDEGTSLEEHFIVSLAGAAATVTTRGVSKVDAKTNKAANQFAHDRGAEVKITDIALIRVINRLNGDEAFDSPAWTGVASVAGLSTPTAGETTKAANVAYVNAVAVAGASDATTTTKGIVELATAAELAAGTATGATGANLVAAGTNFNATSSAAVLVPVTNSSGKLSAGFGGSASTLATLNGSSLVVENPANATATPGANKIVISDSTSKINDGWIGLTTAGDTVYSDGTDLQRLAAGSANAVLTMNSGATAPQWNYPQLSNGVGLSTTTKTYWTFGYPLIDDNFAAPSAGSAFYGSGWMNINHSSGATIITNLSMFNRTANGGTGDTFGTAKAMIIEFGAMNNFAAGQQTLGGLVSSVTALQAYNGATDQAVSFTIDAAGALYAHTTNGGGGAAHTETLITGVTLTTLSTYRIEWNPGVNALFYVNGVLKATITTNLPTSGQMYFGMYCNGNNISIANLQVAVEK